MARDLTGIKRFANGRYRTSQWVPDPNKPEGRIETKRWDADATLTEMRQWREDVRVAARKPQPIAKVAMDVAGFAADALTYLDAVRAMPSWPDRVRDIGEWIAIFGETPSLAIGSARIRAARDQWLTIGPKRVLEKVTGEKPRWISKPLPLSASTVNHRLRALENFYTVLYPKADNPVREVPEADEPDVEPLGHSFALALEILSYMPDITAPKKGGTHEPGSLSRVRFAALLWTGLAPVQLARLKPELVDWIAGTMLVPRRQKGKKSRRARRRQERPRPLLPQALEALKRFFALNAQQRFSSRGSSLGTAVKRAIRAANVVRAEKQRPLIPETIALKDLTRHTFGTEVYRASKNLKAVQDLLGHSDINQSARYALAAVTEHNTEAIRQMAARTRRPYPGKVSPGPVVARERSPRKGKRENA